MIGQLTFNGTEYVPHTAKQAVILKALTHYQNFICTHPAETTIHEAVLVESVICELEGRAS